MRTASAGRRVLVNGAGGGSGTFAVQLAKQLGAHVTGVDNAGKLDFMRSLGAAEVIDYRTGATLLTGFAEFSAMTFNMLGHTEPVQVAVGIVTGNYFEVLGLRTVVGRAFDAREDGPAAEPVMVLTHEYWMRMFGGTPDVVGRAVRINGRTLTIVGVLQPAPHYPQRTDVFVNMVTSPHHLSATMVQGRTHRMTEVFARLTAGTSVTQANVELAGIASRVHTDHPDAYETAAGYQVVATPLRDVMTGEARLTLQLLMATTVLVLLIALVNVTNLMLMRLVGREQELAVRWSLGASAWGLRRLLLMESGVLALAGAGLGLAVAVLSAHVTIGPTESRQGARERYTVRVPTEGAVATVTVDLEIPEGVRVTNVLAGAWSTELRREENRIVGVTWTMEIPAAHFAEFVFNARNSGEGTEIAWKVTQGFADGTSRV